MKKQNVKSATSPSSSAAASSRDNILEVATHEFSAKGLSGARVDEIAEVTNTSKRMIYYYFKSKEGLYRAVLERCYHRLRRLDSSRDLDSLEPMAALREVVRITFDYHLSNPDFVRIVMNENIHQGAHIADITSLKERNRAVITALDRLIARGVAAKVFRPDLDPVDVHMSISALCFYNVSNRYTFSHNFKYDLGSPEIVKRRRRIVVDMIERWCRAGP
jgi:AcrR family transcriptional regulator